MTIWFSVRSAVSNTADAVGRFALVNLVWLVTAALAVTAGAAFRPAYALALLIVPVMCGMTRMAAHATRKDAPRLRHFRDGARHRWRAHLAIGAGQGLVLIAATVNIGIGMSRESLLFALITVVALYVALGTVVSAVAAWPLLLDPERSDLSVRAVLRLALAVVMKRPISMVVIALLELALFVVATEIVVLGLVLPSFAALIATNFVLAVADDLRTGGWTRTTARRSVHDDG